MPKNKKSSKAKNATDRRKEEKSNEEQKEVKISSAKYNWFELILYPQDNEQNHNADVLRYVSTNKYQYEKCIYITHDKDKKDNGESKKSHVHCIIKTSERITLSQLKNRLVYLTYIPHHTENQIRPITEGLSEALLYLLHETFKARQENKTIYSKDELKGDSELINEISIQNRNYIQNEIYQLIEESPFTLDVMKTAKEQYSRSTAIAIQQEFMNKPAFYQTICREERERRKKPTPLKYGHDYLLEISEEDAMKFFSLMKERNLR